MNFENFYWDKQNQTISWTYNGKTIDKRYEDLNFVNYNLQNNYVIVTVGKNFMREQLYYLSFEGKQIFAFDNVNGKISWQYNNQTVDINCMNAEDAHIYFNHNLVMTIIGKSRSDRKIEGFALDGILLFEKEPPEGYIFSYLSMSMNLPTVVCDGGKDQADAYGRTQFHFKIDTKTGDMEKACLAY